MLSERKRYLLADEDALVPLAPLDPLVALIVRHPDLGPIASVARTCRWTAPHRRLAAEKLHDLLASSNNVSPHLLAAKAAGLAEYYWNIRKPQQFWRQVKRLVDRAAARLVDEQRVTLRGDEPDLCCIDLKFSVSTLRGVPERLHLEVDQSDPSAVVEPVVHLGARAVKLGRKWQGGRQVLFDDPALREVFRAIAEDEHEPRCTTLALTLVSNQATTVTARFIATQPRKPRVAPSEEAGTRSPRSAGK